MIREKRSDYPKVVTPRGVAIWPALSSPDFKFKKEHGEYHCRLRLDPAAPGVAELLAQAEEIRDEAYEAKRKKLEAEKKGALLKALTKVEVGTEELDRETGDPTGFITIRASMNAGGLRKKDGSTWTAKPDIFNAVGKQLSRPPEVSSGSEVKLGVRIMDYETDGGKAIGARFELEGAQILKIVTRGARTAADHGFAAEEGDDIDDVEAGHGFSDESGGAADGGDGDDF